ncbi:MAG: hypothetical protein WC603_02400 [Candidatus Paceibacterota bacterium]|jgi:hypothetical protein
MDDFNKRWGIIEEIDYKEEFEKFKIRVLTVFREVDSHVEEEVVENFCNKLGIPVNWTYDDFNYRNYGENIINILTSIKEEKKFYFALELLLNLPIQTLIGYSHDEKYSRNILVKKFFEILNYSKVNLKVIIEDKKVVLYPAGDEMLDVELVDNTLNFLNAEAKKHFVEALKFYQDKKYIKSAEGLRRSLEEFLRNRLKNTKGLNANITELQAKLKKDGRDPQVRNIIQSTFGCLDQYFNENSKHNDGDIDDSENEFLIYQTGLLMRYINSNI